MGFPLKKNLYHLYDGTVFSSIVFSMNVITIIAVILVCGTIL